ncbi:MAG: hypothetical protein OEU76_06480, partial [Cyclobacteriaceae bacterium]|nr:hypothetical protein [Cyclobacteriaceae bacterium]
MKSKLITSYFLFSFVVAVAQTGNYFLSNYSPDEERFNIVCFDMVQDSRGVFYFATQAGILQFDGRNWDIIPTVGTIYSIAISELGDIYAAGSRGFGKIIKDENGLEVYSVLYEQSDMEYIFQILIQLDRIYFLSDKNLFEYEPLEKKTRTFAANEETGPFVSLNEIFNKVFVSTEQNGLFELDGTEIKATSIGVDNTAALILSQRYDDKYLLGTDDNQLFLCSSNFEIKRIQLQDSSYAQASVIVNATWINQNLVAVGTLRGGVIFINPETGTTEEIINYNTGLPDNEVFTLMTDRNLNVWVAHAYGFTRISPSLPFRSFRYYPGLQGNLLCATTYQDKVYVGTSLGLFALMKEEHYDEIRYYVEVPEKEIITTQKASKRKEADLPKAEEVETKDSEKGGFFRFLKRKKSTMGEGEKDSPTTVARNEETGEYERQIISSTRRELRTKKILRSSYYSYQKVVGVDAKILQLIHWKGKLIASGLGGAFEVNNGLPNRITEKPVRFLYASENNSRIIASTNDDQLLQFGFDKEWKYVGPIENITEPIHYIFEEGETAIWFCGFDKVFRLTSLKEEPYLQQLIFNNSNFDKTIGLFLNNEVIIASPAGFFFYNQSTGQLVRGDTLRKPIAYFASSDNLWFRDKHSWYTAGSSGGHDNLQLLNLFSNLRFIDSDKRTGALWIITGSNELLQFNSGQVRNNEVIYPLMLKAILHNDIITGKNYLNVVQDESAFVVEVIKPDYIGNRFVEYRYLLEGLHQDWTEWSTQNNIIRFPYLPTGEYKLQVQSRDIFGRINDMEPVRLNIAPPYWKEPWFFAAEFSVFIFLVLLSFRLSYRFLIVSRLLSLLSIIMFIEFIQTVAGETFSQSSPVIDFGIQVFVAMLILPVEGFLRRYFLQALAKRNEE